MPFYLHKSKKTHRKRVIKNVINREYFFTTKKLSFTIIAIYLHCCTKVEKPRRRKLNRKRVEYYIFMSTHFIK